MLTIRKSQIQHLSQIQYQQRISYYKSGFPSLIWPHAANIKKTRREKFQIIAVVIIIVIIIIVISWLSSSASSLSLFSSVLYLLVLSTPVIPEMFLLRHDVKRGTEHFARICWDRNLGKEFQLYFRFFLK